MKAVRIDEDLLAAARLAIARHPHRANRPSIQCLINEWIRASQAARHWLSELERAPREDAAA